MKTTVKTLWIAILLILTFSISSSCKATDFTSLEASDTYKISACLSSCPSTSKDVKQTTSDFMNTKFSWTADVELGTKPVSEVYCSNQQRLRRVIEDNLFLRNIFLILSNHENLLVHGKTKLFYSDKDPHYALTGSAYYIFTLRRILI